MSEIISSSHPHSRTRTWLDRFAWKSQNYMFLMPLLALLLILMVYPLIYAVQTSFSSFSMATMQPGNFVGFKNYERVLNSTAFWSSLKTTGLVLLVSLPLQMILGITIAYIMSVEWFGVRFLRSLILIPMVITPVVVGSVWKMLLDPLWGFFNYMWGLVGGDPIHWLGIPGLALLSIIIMDTWRETPFIILIMTAGISSMDNEPLEAAWVDGASRWQRLIYVELPMLKEVIISTFIIRWLMAIKMFDLIFVSTRGGPGNTTEVANLYIYDSAFRSLSFENSSAMSILIVVVAMAFTIFFLRFGSRTVAR